jgi:hypothetical protein
MPRLPVDGKKVQEFRVTLGQYERERIDTLVTGLTIRNVGQPLVALLSDVSALLALLGIADVLGIIDLRKILERVGGEFAGWIDDTAGGLYDNYEDAKSAYDTIADAIQGPEVAGVPTGIVGSYFEYQLNTSEKLAVWAYTSLRSGLGGLAGKVGGGGLA